jgi:sugar phosphate isomerase/epimerase
MKGHGVICLKVDQHCYYEHEGLAGAKAEARRLAGKLGSDVVVYVPVYRAKAGGEPIAPPSDAQKELSDAWRVEYDLPF